jgi:hypothetical protein
MNNTRKPLLLSSTLALCLLSGSARADLTEWVNAVAAGSSASYTATNVVMPTIVDVGSLSNAQGLTYEFVINGNDAGLSSALIGAKNTGFGTSSALKFEQFADTGSWGVTLWGVTDWTIAPHTVGVDLHVAWVVNPTAGTTALYVDGVLIGTVPHAPHITNVVGFGEWYDPGGSVDSYSGLMYGTALYESMLSVSEIQEHSDAFHSTEPGTRYCFGASCPCFNNDPNAGCANSAGQGALLFSSGTTSAGVDDLSLHVSGLLPNQPALLFSANNALGAGSGVLFGDGMRCAGGSAVRLGVRSSSLLGEATWGPGLSSSGGWGGGQTRRFQCWYPDPVSSPCGAGFNFSSAVEVSFTP